MGHRPEGRLALKFLSPLFSCSVSGQCGGQRGVDLVQVTATTVRVAVKVQTAPSSSRSCLPCLLVHRGGGAIPAGAP